MARYIDVDRHSFPTLHQKELNDYMKGWNACLKSVLQQPTADVVEVKHGEWILDKKITSPIFLNCSLCGNTADKDIHGNYIGITPYCSMCGAKMNGRSEPK